MVIPVAVHTTGILTLLTIQVWAIYHRRHGVVTTVFAMLLILSNVFGLIQFSLVNIELVSKDLGASLTVNSLTLPF